MRKLIAGSTVFLLISLAGCSRGPRIQALEEEPSRLASAVHMADPRTDGQLIKGFYGLEEKAWRWTMGTFAVRLRSPLGASQRGATLELKATVPEQVLAKLQKITLSATVNGTALAPEVYSTPGPAVYSREVPPNAFSAAGDATVEFAVDKTFVPGGADTRELGLVVASIALQAK